jgi:hypothetical protein
LGEPELQDGDVLVWKVLVFIRNASELPVKVDALDLSAQSWGFVREPRRRWDEAGEHPSYSQKKFSEAEGTSFVPGTIAPGDTWSDRWMYRPSPMLTYEYMQPQVPITSVVRVVVTDAAGYQWEVRSDKAGPARRVVRGRRWW